MKDNTILFSSTEEVISLLQNIDGENVRLNITINQTEETTLYKDVDDPVMLLPRELKRKLIHRAAFRRAFERGYLTFENGKIISHFKTNSLLTYFSGRVFCNDKSDCKLGYVRWIKGNEPFPEKELCLLFGIPNLREIRKNHVTEKNYQKIIKGYEVVDNLFFTE